MVHNTDIFLLEFICNKWKLCQQRTDFHTHFFHHQCNPSKKINSTPFIQKKRLRLLLIRGNCMILLTSHFFFFLQFRLFNFSLCIQTRDR